MYKSCSFKRIWHGTVQVQILKTQKPDKQISTIEWLMKDVVDPMTHDHANNLEGGNKGVDELIKWVREIQWRCGLPKRQATAPDAGVTLPHSEGRRFRNDWPLHTCSKMNFHLKIQVMLNRRPQTRGPLSCNMRSAASYVCMYFVCVCVCVCVYNTPIQMWKISLSPPPL